MGKNKKGGKKNNDIFVSVCTPTYNRRPFINSMIKCFDHQTYPKDKIEWIIIDDGTDKIEDLIKYHPNVKYYSYDEKMPLGKKRNLMHEKSKGDILVYMDDDDYYPPCRIQHAVDMLQQHPKALCAGSSEIYIYFKHINQMVQFGPYGPNHATAGTFAFKRQLLKEHKYNDTAALEEKAFLKDYTVPFVQLEPKKTILVFSHVHNTFDKKTLLDNRHPQFVKDSDKTVDDFVKESDLKDFYMNQIEVLLKDYEPGRPDMKPDVLKQIKELKEEREKQAIEMQQNQSNGIPPQMIQMMKENPKMLKEILKKQNNITDEQFEMLKQQIEMQEKIGGGIQNQQGQGQGQGQIVIENNGQQKVLNNNEIIQLLQQQQNAIQMLQNKVNEMQPLLFTI